MGNACSFFLCQNFSPSVNLDPMKCCCGGGDRQDGDEQELIANGDGNSIVDPRSSVGDQTLTNNTINNNTMRHTTSAGDQSSTSRTIIYNNTIINAENFHTQWWPPHALPPPSQPPPPPPPPFAHLPSLKSSSDSAQLESIRNIFASKSHVAHSEMSQYTVWRDDPRFTKVAELLKVWWFDIGASIKLEGLSRSTTYAAYLIFKINPDTSLGLNNLQQATVSLRNFHRQTYFYQRKLVCLDPERNPTQSRGVRKPVSRSDGWMELELGQFYCDDDTDDQEEVELGFEDKNAAYPKRGLIYAGIEVRPIQV